MRRCRHAIALLPPLLALWTALAEPAPANPWARMALEHAPRAFLLSTSGVEAVFAMMAPATPKPGANAPCMDPEASASLAPRMRALWVVAHPSMSGPGRQHALTLFNPDQERATFDLPLPPVSAIPDGAPIMTFDLEAHALNGPFADRIVHALPAQSHVRLAVVPLRSHPQAIAVSPSAGSSVMDLSNVTWQPETRTLSGRSQPPAHLLFSIHILARTLGPATCAVIAWVGITGPSGRELAIAPGEGIVTRPDDPYSTANTPEAPFTTLYAPEMGPDGVARFSFSSGSGEPIAWRVIFAPSPEP